MGSYPNSHEAMISQETFENVMRILQTDTRTSPSKEIVFPLSGLRLHEDYTDGLIPSYVHGEGRQFIY